MADTDVSRRLAESAATVRQLLGREALPETLVVLGSGFKGFEARLTAAKSVDLTRLPHFPVPCVEGHGAALVVGKLQGREISVLTGRVHLYEGHDACDVAYPIRALAPLGVRRVLLTNAAGSVDPTLRPGQVVAVRDQINMTGRNCLIGAEGRELGPLFLDMGTPFDAGWRAAIVKAVPAVKEGVYAGVLGPAYETPAETRMLGLLGAHVVGMSTVQEVLAARHLGLTVACLSFITNMAGGLGEALSHAEVLSLVDRHKAALHSLIETAVALGEHP